jgi:hypothetical protein
MPLRRLAPTQAKQSSRGQPTGRGADPSAGYRKGEGGLDVKVSGGDVGQPPLFVAEAYGRVPARSTQVCSPTDYQRSAAPVADCLTGWRCAKFGTAMAAIFRSISCSARRNLEGVAGVFMVMERVVPGLGRLPAVHAAATGRPPAAVLLDNGKLAGHRGHPAAIACKGISAPGRNRAAGRLRAPARHKLRPPLVRKAALAMAGQQESQLEDDQFAGLNVGPLCSTPA